MADVRGVFSRTLVSTGGMVAQGLARFLYTVAIGRVAGAESLADVSTLLSLSVYASLFWPAAAGAAASRFLPLTETAAASSVVLRRSFLWATIALTVIGAGAVAVVSGGNLGLTLSCALLIPAYSGYVFTRGALLGKDQILRATVLDSITAALSIAALVFVLFADAHWALMLPVIGAYALFAVLAWPRGSRIEVSAGHRATVLRYTRTTVLMLIATGGLLPAAQILVRMTETPLVAGLFAAGLSLATPASLVSQAVNQVLIPQFASMHGAGAAAIVRMHRRLFLITGLGFAVVFGLLIALAPWILSLFYGDRFSSGALPMQLLLIGVFLMSLIAAPSAYLMALGHQRVSARVWIVSFTVGTVVMLALAPAFGQWGVLAGYLLGTGIGTVSICVLGLRRAPISDAFAEDR